MDFILVPDRISGNKIKSELAKKNIAGAQVGTFRSLLEQLKTLWILPSPQDDFQDKLRASALKLNHCFWSKSIAVDENAVLQKIQQSLQFLLSSLPLDKQLNTNNVPQNDPSDRDVSYFNDLVTLHKKMGFALPEEHALAHLWFQNKALTSIETITVSYLKGTLNLNTWQQQVLDTLDTNNANNSQYLTLLSTLFNKQSSVNTELNNFTNNLFKTALSNKQAATKSIKFIKLRDNLQEVETVVSSVQKAISDGVTAQEIAIVVPSNTAYLNSVTALLKQVGVLTSYHQTVSSYFQWDKQVIKDLITAYIHKKSDQKLLPNMLLASIVSNPLMPWSMKIGQVLAQKSIDNNDKVDEHLQDNKHLKLYKLINEITPDNCFEWLKTIIPLLCSKMDKKQISKVSLLDFISTLEEQNQLYKTESKFDALKNIASQIIPCNITNTKNTKAIVLNGVKVTSSNQWLLEPVNHMYLLGFNQGHYGVAKPNTGVFKLNGQTCTALNIKNKQKAQQTLFETQFSTLLKQATQSITFFMSEQTFDGDKLSASDTLFDIANVLQKTNQLEPELLVQNIEDEQATFPFKNIKPVIYLPEEKPTKNKKYFSFEQDLIALHKNKKGEQQQESPSSLEKMMISPLAWLLSRQGFSAKGWKVQDLDVMLQGTIAHKVFELYFDEKQTDKSFTTLFTTALKQDASYLLNNFWKMERIHLGSKIEAALNPFINWCKQNNWQVIKKEEHLIGDLWEIKLHGYADAILKKDNHYLVLDYKKSSSSDRKKRLEAGYDLQTKIYCALYRQINDDAKKVSSGYYTLNDQTLILDFEQGDEVQDISCSYIDNIAERQSKEASADIKKTIADLKMGKVKLNTETDIDFWGSVSVKASYTFDDAPIVKHFYLSESATEKGTSK